MKAILSCSLAFLFSLQPVVLLAQQSPREDAPTPAEKKAAQELAERFTQRWEANGDMGLLLDELYAPDFIERFIEQRKQETIHEQGRFGFAPDFMCDAKLLASVTPIQWRRFYAATESFNLILMTVITNTAAGYLARGEEIPEEKFAEVIQCTFRSPAVALLLTRHPMLGRMLSDSPSDEPLATPSELAEVTLLLEQVNALLKQEQGESAFRLTSEARRVVPQIMDGEEAGRIGVIVLTEEHWGLPPGTRMLSVTTLSMQRLEIAEVYGQYRVLWATTISHEI